MQLRSIQAHGMETPFADGPYIMSHVTQVALATRVLRVETADGAVGYGEIVRATGHDPGACIALENDVLGGLHDPSMEDLPALARRFRSQGNRLYGLAFGLETAHLDLIGRMTGAPLYSLLGGRLSDDAADYLSLSCDAPDAVSRRIAGEGATRQVIQVKLGDDDIDLDNQRIDAALAAAAPDQCLLMDFNGALTVDQANGVIGQHADGRIIWEEPCNTVPMNLAVAEKTGAPVMFDQCLKSLDLYAAVCTRSIDASVCIKPAAPLGGLSVARAARDLAIDAGVAVRIDGPWSGPIGTAAALHLAVGVPPDLLIAGCDLTEPLRFADGWTTIEHRPNNRIAPLAGPGHGVTPPAEAMFDTLWIRP